MDDTELGTQKFQDFQEEEQQFLQDSEACCFTILKILNGFPGIQVKIHKILWKFMDFQSGSLSSSYSISNVVHVWIFSGISQYKIEFLKVPFYLLYNKYKMNRYLQSV